MMWPTVQRVVHTGVKNQKPSDLTFSIIKPNKLGCSASSHHLGSGSLSPFPQISLRNKARCLKSGENSSNNGAQPFTLHKTSPCANGLPSSPKTSFHGPFQVLERSLGMFIPPQDHWAGPSLSLLWVPTCWRCLAGLARTLTPAPGDGRGGPVGAGARRRFPGKLLCSRKLHEGLFLADPADAPSPLQPQLEFAGIEG